MFLFKKKKNPLLVLYPFLAMGQFLSFKGNFFKE